MRGQDAEVGRPIVGTGIGTASKAPAQRHRRLVETKLGNGRLADPTNTSLRTCKIDFHLDVQLVLHLLVSMSPSTSTNLVHQEKLFLPMPN